MHPYANDPAWNRKPAFPLEEPSAAHREMATQLRQMYVAMVQAGFTPDQAMQAVGTTIAATIHSIKGDS